MSEATASHAPGDHVDGAGDLAGAGVAHLVALADEATAAAGGLRSLAAAITVADEAFSRNGLTVRLTVVIPPALARYLPLPPAPPAPPPPPPPPRRRRRVTGADKASADERGRQWWLAREAALPPGQKPPSARKDWQDAQTELPGVPRATIRALRPLAWQ